MNDKKLLVDFGSTFTKVVCIDLSQNMIIAKSKHFSTVETDVTEGLRECLKDISNDSGIRDIDKVESFACSSAAGGLKIVCIGFVPDYSSQAANLAALGAGAKVVGCFSFEITKREIDQIGDMDPDIILLTGGTDGGDKKVIIHNCKMLSSRDWPDTHIIVAGNKAAQDEISAIVNENYNISLVNNVMPEVGRLEVNPCNNKIRELFINNIVEAKGIGKARALIKNILMPTPLAVLDAARLLAEGYGDISGIGELMVVDVGGATTDVHSIAEGKPTRRSVSQVGLPEPYAKRTVEGDLGLRYNIDKLLELARERGFPSDIEQIAVRFQVPGYFPDNNKEKDYHARLSRLAVEIAINRHVGRIEAKYGITGEMFFQYGKDFSNVRSVIGTGGPIIYSGNSKNILLGALFQEDAPFILKPVSPKFYLDADYILYAGGLLSQFDPERALAFMLKHIKEF